MMNQTGVKSKAAEEAGNARRGNVSIVERLNSYGGFLQGLKPFSFAAHAPGLKPQPPKERGQTFEGLHEHAETGRKGHRGIALPSVAWLMAIVALTGGCKKQEAEKETVFAVQVTPAAKGTVAHMVTAEAVVFPLQQAIVAPKITSTITEFKVQRGSRVRKGELLATLENKDLAGQAEASKGDFETADANYVIAVNAGLPQQIQKAELDAAAAKTGFEAAQKVYDSRKALFEQGAIPRRDLDTAGVSLAQARSQSEQSRKQLADLQRLGKEQQLKAALGSKDSAEGKYRAAAALLSYSEIRSPIDGVVTDRPLYVGDLAAANQPILTVMDTSRLILKSHIPQAEAATLKLGHAAELTVPGVDQPVMGKVSLVSPALDPGSTTVEVWVEVTRPRAELRPGITVEERITGKTAKDTVLVPTAAVFKNAEGAEYVLIAGQDQKAHQVPVQVGVRHGELTQIVNGIQEGDAVVTAGGYGVPDGAAIQIANGKGEAASGEKSGQESGGPAGTTRGSKAIAKTGEAAKASPTEEGRP